jgi:hypothetical protein
MKKMIFLFILVGILACKTKLILSDTALVNDLFTSALVKKEVKEEIINKANLFLKQDPVPITNFRATRSAGGINDFYSEGDYWWPDPANPDGPYIRRDGQSNPDNFDSHRKAMRDLNIWVPTLVAAYEITKDKKYAVHAMKHIRAFLINEQTRMNPNLLYGQAIKGLFTGRGIGIIDSIHLIEVAKAIKYLIAEGLVGKEETTSLKKWFNDYVTWMTTHEYGIAESKNGNNHSTWWAAQVAVFADLVGRQDLLKVASDAYKVMLSDQMANDGSFPLELARTKPYIYTLFNLEAFSVLAEAASTSGENLWIYQGQNGGLQKAWNFMSPFISNKSTWIKAPDVMYFDQIPVRTAGIYFAAKAYGDRGLLSLWEKLSPNKQSEEIIRNFAINQPLLW